MSELPKGWVSISIDEITSDVSYGVTATSDPEVGDLKLLRITDIQDNKVNWATVPYCKYDIKFENARLCDDDIVVARTGATVGKSFLIKKAVENSVFASYLIRLRCNSAIQPKYLSRFLNTPSYWRQISEQKAGIGQPNVNGTKLKTLNVPLAPQAEQTRIVEKLDEVLAQVDTIKARLDGIPAILKRFRQSVLAAAVSGRLTEEWRRKNSSSNVRSLIESCVAVDKKNAIKPFRKDEINNDIPQTWEWVRLARIAEVISGIAKGSKTSSAVISRPYLRVANVQRGYLDLSEVKEISVPLAKAKSLELKRGDILFNEGGDIDKLGRGWIWEEQIPDCIHQNHVFRARVYSVGIEPKYISYYGNSSGKDYFLREGTQSVNLANINKTTLSLLPIPLPPVEEQKEIVRLVDQFFAFADTIEAQVKKAQARVDNLTQSILAKAFRGELVAQDPADEPAEKLLERIAQARKEAEALAKAAKKVAKTK